MQTKNLIVLAVALLSVVLLVVFGVLASNAHCKVSQMHPTDSSYEDERRKYIAFVVLTLVSLAGLLVSGGLGMYFNKAHVSAGFRAMRDPSSLSSL